MRPWGRGLMPQTARSLGRVLGLCSLRHIIVLSAVIELSACGTYLFSCTRLYSYRHICWLTKTPKTSSLEHRKEAENSKSLGYGPDKKEWVNCLGEKGEGCNDRHALCWPSAWCSHRGSCERNSISLVSILSDVRDCLSPTTVLSTRLFKLHAPNTHFKKSAISWCVVSSTAHGPVNTSHV